MNGKFPILLANKVGDACFIKVGGKLVSVIEGRYINKCNFIPSNQDHHHPTPVQHHQM